MNFSEEEAYEFFVSRIIEQAKKEEIILSSIEQDMLRFSVQDEHADLEMQEAFNQQYDMAEYEGKVARLIKDVFDKELREAPSDREKEAVREHYRSAYKTLRQQDSYLVVMVDRAIGRYLKKWGIF